MKYVPDPVLDSVLRGNTAVLRELLAAGAPTERRDKAGRTPLSNAVISENPEITEVLLAAGAEVDATDNDGFTPLHHATRHHSAALALLLLRAGARVDAGDKFGNTPLSNAVFESRGRGEVIRTLLEAGANQHATNRHGVSPRSLAASIANYDILRHLPPG